MSTATPEAETFVDGLVEFRSRLPESEQGMLDALAARAFHAAPKPSGTPESAAAVGEDELRAFFRKLEDHRDSLPERERPVVDAMVVEAGAAEPPDVEAHYFIEEWSRIGNPMSWEWYAEKCRDSSRAYPNRVKDLELEQAFGSWLPFTTNRLYRCGWKL